MLPSSISSALPSLYQQGKVFITYIGILWAAFTAFRWIKDIRDKDLKEIRENDLRGIKTDIGSVSGEINVQTKIIAEGFSSLQAATTRELSELRSDFRTFYTSPEPIMIPARARAPRKRPSKAEKPKPKPSPKAIETAKVTKTAQKAKPRKEAAFKKTSGKSKRK